MKDNTLKALACFAFKKIYQLYYDFTPRNLAKSVTVE